jgi:hypothetical protein
MSTTKNKRKKVNVKINKTRKSSPDALGIDLKSVMEAESPDERQGAPKKVAKERQKPKKPALNAPAAQKAKAPKRQKLAGRQSGLQLNLYRKIAYSFIFLTLALLAIIFYFFFIKVTITVVPKQERTSSNLIIDVYDEDKNIKASKLSIPGVVESIEVKEVKSYLASGREVIGEETTGKVIIINNYNKNQPLVATTRLLTPDNKLFRIKNTVNVPAGGTVEVEVYADKPGPDMEIGPTKFTIPGLWAGLQDKIFAESKEKMKYQQKAKKKITQDDIDNGIKDIRRSLLLKAEKEVREKYREYDKVLHSIDENSVSIDVDGKVGEEKEEFTITMTTLVVAVAFNDKAIKEMARGKLVSVVADDKKLVEFNEDNLSYGLDTYDLEQGTATVNVTFGGRIAPNSSADIIDREKILGLTREQLNDFLDNNPKIESYDVEFFPSFIERVPNLVDRIKIKIKL